MLPSESPESSNFASASGFNASFLNDPDSGFESRNSGDSSSVFSPVSATSETSAPSAQTPEAAEASKIGESNRQVIEAMILKAIPAATPETVSAWAESFAGMDLSDVEFLLEQKQSLCTNLQILSSGSVSSDGAAFPKGGAWDLPRDLYERHDTQESEKSPIRLIESNLQSIFSVGYRRIVVLPEAISKSAETSASLTSLSPSGSEMALKQIPPLTFRCFDAGKTVTSPMPLHVAIVGTETACMFCLDGGRYTRRGDFRLLTDRRLGIVTPSGEFAAKNSPVIPDNTTRIKIHSNGLITFNDASGAVAEVGRLEVVRFESMEHLTTEDGVFFSCTSEIVPQVVPPTESILLVGQLELSNVNQADEEELLKILQATLR